MLNTPIKIHFKGILVDKAVDADIDIVYAIIFVYL